MGYLFSLLFIGLGVGLSAVNGIENGAGALDVLGGLAFLVGIGGFFVTRGQAREQKELERLAFRQEVLAGQRSPGSTARGARLVPDSGSASSPMTTASRQKRKTRPAPQPADDDEEVVYECPECDKEFKTERGYLQHWELKHE